MTRLPSEHSDRGSAPQIGSRWRYRDDGTELVVTAVGPTWVECNGNPAETWYTADFFRDCEPVT